MAYGIGQQLDDASKLSIKELVQLQSMDPSLIYTLALQEKQKLQAAANNQEALGMQTPQSTITNQMEGRMPGVQMAAARTIPRPQMPQGIAAAPAQNMQAVGRAQGGIIGYADGGTPTLGAMPQNVVSPDQIKQDAAMYQNLEAALAAAKTPEGKARVKMQLDALIRNMGNEHGKVMQYIDSTKGFVHPRTKGMNKGGEVKKFQSGDFVGIEGEESPLTADGDEYRFNGELISAEEYAEIARQINAAGLPVNNNKRADWNRGSAAPGAVLDVVKENIRGVSDAIIDPERNPLYRAGRGIRDYAEDPDRNIVYKAGEAGLGALGDMVNYTPSSTEGVAEGLAQMLPKNASALADLLAGKDRAEEKAKQLNAANIEALGVAEEKSAPKTLAEMLMGAQKQFDANPRDRTQEEETGNKEPLQKEGGIRNALSKTKPFLGKAMGIAEILGRGAGSSKGFEGAKIVEESAKLREAQADRDAKMAEQQALIAARKLELDARLASDTAIAMQELDSELYASIMQELESGPLAEELDAIEEDLKNENDAFSIPLLGNFFVKDEVVEEKLRIAKLEILKREFKNRKGVLASLSGTGGQEGASEGITDAADFF